MAKTQHATPKTAGKCASTAKHVDEGLGEISSGNVFADLGFEDSATELLKADLVIALGAIIKQNGLTQTVAAARLGTTQPKMSLLLRGRTENVSAEKLMEYLTRMDRQVHIVVTPTDQTLAQRERPRVTVTEKPWRPMIPRSTTTPAQPSRLLYAAKKASKPTPAR